MNEPTRLLEFVFINENTKFPYISTVDVKEIGSVSQGQDECHCVIKFKDSSEKIVCGTYRAILNRYLYCLNKRRDFYEDEVLIPSRHLIYGNDKVEVDNIHFDEYQLEQLKTALGITD